MNWLSSQLASLSLVSAASAASADETIKLSDTDFGDPVNYAAELMVTDQCLDALGEYGLLQSEGHPAGAEIYSQDTWRVAVISNEDPETFSNYFLESDQELLNSEGVIASPFPEDIEERIQDALHYWKPGQDIQFVPPEDNPDFVIGAYQYADPEDSVNEGAFATFPQNDATGDPRLQGTSGPLAVAMNMTTGGNNLTSKGFNEKLIHELGHNLGGLHPEMVTETAHSNGFCLEISTTDAFSLGKLSGWHMLLLNNIYTEYDVELRERLHEAAQEFQGLAP